MTNREEEEKKRCNECSEVKEDCGLCQTCKDILGAVYARNNDYRNCV